jgi:membrane dipeptidase
MLIIDSHLDLAMNALYWDRDLTLELDEIRAREAAMTGKGRGNGTVSLPELGHGRVAVASATLLARTGSSPSSGLPAHASTAIAHAFARGQLAYYEVLEALGRVRILRTKDDFDAHWREWTRWDASRSAAAPVPGFVVSMEGADAVAAPDHIANWWDGGVRVLSLVHYMDNAYAHGTGSEGGLEPAGRDLLDRMRSVGMILDLTHLADQSFWEALDAWDGPVMASHNNCRALVSGQRQFSDDQLEAIFERGGVVGSALDAWMLHPGWVRGETSPDVVGLDAFVDHIVHVCELAGDCSHAAIGSDLDGGFGNEQTPRDLRSIRDLQKVPDMLRARGVDEAGVNAIMHGNWAAFFERHLPSADEAC